MAMNKFIDLTGQKFGRLTVQFRGETDKRHKNTNPSRFWCLCDCGKTKLVLSSNLKRGITKSCGCLAKENSSKRRLKLVLNEDVAAILTIIRAYKAGAIKKDRIFDLTYEETKFIILSNCKYCGTEPSRNIKLRERKKSSQSTLKFNGIDRIDNKKSYTLDNCVSCCTICNLSKHTLTLQQWNEWLNRISNFRNKNETI